MRPALASILVVVGLTVSPLPVKAQAPAAPSSLQETYGDWTVACATRAGARRCVMAQRLVQQDGRQIAGIELAETDVGLSGMLVMPFGLLLDEGTALSVDGALLTQARFSTCLPGGCLVPLVLDPVAVSRLAGGERLEIAATANETREPFGLGMSLEGFSAARERLSELAR
ncbi:invasion associated locus B family protein [Salinarimonas sp.]|uniref:invasion associated locus B family protein n=1 Tax=Salinarimonas sp. TaxID=2766526 RepID=UPI0032D91222